MLRNLGLNKNTIKNALPGSNECIEMSVLFKKQM